MPSLKTSLVAASLAAATTAVVAQPAPPPPERAPMPARPDGDRPVIRRFMHGGWGDLSAAGRDIMRAATQPPADFEQRRERERALDTRAAELLAAERLDVGAMRRVMDEKAAIRASADRERQQRLLEAYQRLSAADRKALADGMRSRGERFDRLVGPGGDIRVLREHRRARPTPPVVQEQEL